VGVVKFAETIAGLSCDLGIKPKLGFSHSHRQGILYSFGEINAVNIVVQQNQGSTLNVSVSNLHFVLQSTYLE
jgi:hypothetical protein